MRKATLLAVAILAPSLGWAAHEYYAPVDESCMVKHCSPGDVVFVYSTQGDPAFACYEFKSDPCFTPKHNQRVRIYEMRGEFVKVTPLDHSKAYWIIPDSLKVKALKPED